MEEMTTVAAEPIDQQLKEFSGHFNKDNGVWNTKHKHEIMHFNMLYEEYRSIKIKLNRVVISGPVPIDICDAVTAFIKKMEETYSGKLASYSSSIEDNTIYGVIGVMTLLVERCENFYNCLKW